MRPLSPSVEAMALAAPRSAGRNSLFLLSASCSEPKTGVYSSAAFQASLSLTFPPVRSNAPE